MARALPDVAFFVFAAVAAINSVVTVHMKIEVNRRVSPHDRISWWAFNTKNEIARKYRTLEPESILPAVSRLTWWLCALSFAGMISISLFVR